MTPPLASLSAQPGWREAVVEAAAQAQAALSAANGRVDKAAERVLAGAVTLLDDGTATVTSQQDPGTVYTVRPGHCACPDFPNAPAGQCKHRIAVWIAKKATQLLTQRQQAHSGTPPASPRAPAATHRRQAPTADPRIAEAVVQAERVCQAAVEATPPAYRGFLLFLPRKKKVGGSQKDPLYAEIVEPYMGVDGRVKMALDEHRSQGATLVIQTQFVLEPVSGQLLCQATVTSALLGSVTAHARVFVGGSGVNETNPLENAETSAVGRALGFVGYGLYGTGIASADEVLQAQALRQETGDTPLARDPAAADRARPTGKPPTARQQGLLHDLLRETGVPDDEIAAHLALVTTSREASARIDQLRSQLRQREA
jgi:hypothetical protein